MAVLLGQPGAHDMEEAELERLGHTLLRMGGDARREFLADLDAPMLDVAERAIAHVVALGWRAHPAAMAERLDPQHFQRYAYIDFLSQKALCLVDGRSRRQIWNLPGRMGKSLLASRWLPVWVLDRTGGRARLILVSYAYGLAMENAVFVRDQLVYHSDLLRGQLKPDRRKRDRFVTEEGGGVLAAGMGGTIVGFGAGDGGGIVLDDPLKNWQEAHSESRRNASYNTFRGTLRNRLDSEDDWILIIHHRYHEDDITARLTADSLSGDGDEWEVVSLPALAGDNDALGRAPGEALCPERFDREACLRRARGLGTYLASALEQQNPTPEEGNELLRAWFHIAGMAEAPRKADRAITSWDLKLKDRESGDYVVGQCWWRVGQASWLMDQLRGQYDHATTANAIALLHGRHPEATVHVVEAAGSADEVLPALRTPQPGYVVTDEMAARLGMTDAERVAVQDVRRTGMTRIHPEPAKHDKTIRAREWIAPEAERGMVRIVEDLDGLPGLLAELAAFPQGTHDDQVDCMSQALKNLGKSRQARGHSAAADRLPEPSY